MKQYLVTKMTKYGPAIIYPFGEDGYDEGDLFAMDLATVANMIAKQPPDSEVSVFSVELDAFRTTS